MVAPRRIEWLNKNRYRRYPFIEDSALVGGGITIPDGVMLDFQLVSFRNAATPVRLIRVEIIHAVVNYAIFRFAFDSFTPGWPGYIDFSVPETASFPYTANAHMDGIHNGWVIFDDAAETFINDNAPGIYSFNTQVEPALISFQNKHRVESVTATYDVLQHDTLIGNIQIQEGYNCNVAVSSNLNRITISAIVGGGAGVLCTSSSELNCNDVLLRINGLHADDNGNFMLLAGDGMRASGTTFSAAQPKEELVCKGKL